MKLVQTVLVLFATILTSACQTTTPPAGAGHDCVVTPYDMVECSPAD
ncbi:hypothetical protein [Pelagibacterium halotolerans]|uniref:Lipoprotein n=1 Tax=Pelagibacterium halotolerans (strain DSM 22347 / JCM 15775 / CGMCC 1.7692 / B2) TaxID=1082931 RepID=G4R9A6_PELHB|nr:hypothetical protein [Pelagibacterium halotolerans]AEQ53440.1 hypothetical protein KKY_3454 [Pelagibacterium halotolerans B2]QJR20379.1 hypothetical protein HKM20_19175 [Pelagibacterium halotolerans]SEA60293.1 hypothetical protein SAMN05428936_105150 [Pelagibacterium halotolerans]